MSLDVRCPTGVCQGVVLRRAGGLDRPDEGSPDFGDLDHERGRVPEALPPGGLLAHLVSGRDPVAFLAEGEPRGSQIHVRWMDDEGAVSQITRMERSPSNLRWSRGGTRIAFTRQVDAGTPWRIDMPPRPEGAEWTAGPKIAERAVYRRERHGYVDKASTGRAISGTSISIVLRQMGHLDAAEEAGHVEVGDLAPQPGQCPSRWR